MTQNDPKNWTSKRQLMPPAAYNAQDSAAVDTPVDSMGFRYALISVECGANAATWALQVTSSATVGGTYASIAGALITVLATDDNVILTGVIDLHGANVLEGQRWLGLSGTGASGVDILGVSVTLFNPRSTDELDYSVGGVDELAFEV